MLQPWSSYKHNIDRNNPGNCFIKPDFRVDVPTSWTTLQSSCNDAEFVSPDGKAGLHVTIRPAPYDADRVETLLRALILPWRELFEYQEGEVTVTGKPLSVEPNITANWRSTRPALTRPMTPSSSATPPSTGC